MRVADGAGEAEGEFGAGLEGREEFEGEGDAGCSVAAEGLVGWLVWE